MARRSTRSTRSRASTRPSKTLTGLLATIALAAAYRLASIIGAADGALDPPGAPSARH